MWSSNYVITMAFCYIQALSTQWHCVYFGFLRFSILQVTSGGSLTWLLPWCSHVFLGQYFGATARHEKYTSHRVFMWMLITMIYFEVSVNMPFKVNKLIRHLKRKSRCMDDHNAEQCSQTFFSMAEPPVRIFHNQNNPHLWKGSHAWEGWQQGTFLLPLVRHVCKNMKQTQ